MDLTVGKSALDRWKKAGYITLGVAATITGIAWLKPGLRDHLNFEREEIPHTVRTADYGGTHAADVGGGSYSRPESAETLAGAWSDNSRPITTANEGPDGFLSTATTDSINQGPGAAQRHWFFETDTKKQDEEDYNASHDMYRIDDDSRGSRIPVAAIRTENGIRFAQIAMHWSAHTAFFGQHLPLYEKYHMSPFVKVEGGETNHIGQGEMVIEYTIPELNYKPEHAPAMYFVLMAATGPNTRKFLWKHRIKIDKGAIEGSPARYTLKAVGDEWFSVDSTGTSNATVDGDLWQVLTDHATKANSKSPPHLYMGVLVDPLYRQSEFAIDIRKLGWSWGWMPQ